jgi:tetratricopeptide (TPR) repeat protein
MKMLFRNITNALPISFLMGALMAFASTGWGFQVETSLPLESADFSSQLHLAESGEWSRSLRGIQLLFEGRYEDARREVQSHPSVYPSWFENYLTGLEPEVKKLVRRSSAHFELWTPADQVFLADIALPALENAWDYFTSRFQFRPKRKIRVEVYPTKEAFSAASTLSVATLESSGAIGICKFHRLMIVSPRALPMGYRWLDALTHEYVHLLVNEMSGSRAELWFHEGVARYYETAPRANPPLFLTPLQKTDLKKAEKDQKLISFARMSPSLVYLKDQSEVSLAFSQVAYAVSILVQDFGDKGLSNFLKSLKGKPFSTAFGYSFQSAPDEFQGRYQSRLQSEIWEETRGALSDDVRFTPAPEEDFIGADAKMQVRFGDRMRAKGQYESALLQYERALEQEPDNAVILLKAARACLALNQTSQAKIYLERAVDKNPNYVTPYIELAKLVERKRAQELIREGLAINPFDPALQATAEQDVGK